MGSCAMPAHWAAADALLSQHAQRQLGAGAADSAALVGRVQSLLADMQACRALALQPALLRVGRLAWKLQLLTLCKASLRLK